MKILSLTCCLLLSTLAIGQSKYESAILKGKQMLFADGNIEDLQKASNYFERIAQKERGAWLPLYYQAVAQAFTATKLPSTDDKESALNHALELVGKSKGLEKNAEILSLEGFVQMLRLSLDPASRGQTLSPVIFGLFQQALAIEPDNPRALLFMGQMQYGTAQFFGSGYDEACGMFQKAVQAFEANSDKDGIFPDWGYETAQVSLEKCNQ